MPDLQLPLHLPRHRNHQLFSDHYLDEILPARLEWQALLPQAKAVLEELTGILDCYTPSSNERQTEKDLVCPVLDLLGHTYEVQPSLRTPDGAHTPDYVFYQDNGALVAHKDQTLTDSVASEGAFAVGDAKHWNRPLDIAVRRKNADALSNRNPSFQIYYYMLHSGVEWGLLTSGKLWRLYHRDSAHKLDVYYEVDLEDLVRSGDADRFLYFYAFFRREAFQPGPLSLAELLHASVEYAQGIGNTLKSQVYEALRHLAQGFLDYSDNRLAPTPEALEEIHDSSLILLYRLIFILYAEARELLPVRESDQYRDTYSLLAIKDAVARDLQRGRRLLPASARLWPQLRELFHAIDQGSPPLKVATFNGGLFDPAKHPFLEEFTVGDAHLQLAIDGLARAEGYFIDYRDLSVRHMGTIYEGLLEFKLVPCERTPDGWTVDLITDKGERKATGSYYTPDYIVKFIVEHTVGPALRDAVASKTSDADVVDAVLTVNVLDPAMGSGHFLVEATEYIARFLVDLGVVPEGKTPEEADLAFWKRRVAQACVYGVDLNPLAVELAKLSLWLVTVAKDRPLSFLDHHLRPGNSLLGASLSALRRHSADTVRKGLRKKAAPAAENQTSLFDEHEFAARMGIAVANTERIEEIEASTVAQVKEQEALYAEWRKGLMGRYGRLADLITAQHFAFDVTPEQWAGLVDMVMGRALAPVPALQAMLAEVEAIAARERFFHWELEFPEVYFDRHGRPLGDQGGFEAVVGNPPYVAANQLAPYKPYLQERFRTFHSAADLYVYFYERALEQTRQQGRMAYISSGTFARANFGGPFRKWLPSVAQMDAIIDFGENQPFQGAEMVRPSIVVLQKRPTTDGFRSLFIAQKVPASLEAALAQEGVSCDASALEQPEWTFQAAESTRLFEKVSKAGRPLGDIVGGHLFSGLKTGLNEAFIIDQRTFSALVDSDPACSVVLRRMLRGEDLRPWYQEDEGRWLIAIPSGWTRRTLGEGLSEKEAWLQFAQRHPTIAAHLHPFAAAGRRRGDKGDYWWELRPCDYYDALGQPKIVWSDVSKLPRCSYADPDIYVGNTGHFIPAAQPELLALLQSRVLWFVIMQICTPLRLRAGLWQFRMIPQFARRLPIPDMPDPDREALASLAMQATDRARTRYELHQRVRHRIITDLQVPEGKLNQKLTAWWTLDFSALRAELRKLTKRDLPVNERDEWEAWHTAQCTEHTRLTDQIIAAEEDLNVRVYSLFGLTPTEIALIEETTKYRYGEV
jgi:hypothetical protein